MCLIDPIAVLFSPLLRLHANEWLLTAALTRFEQLALRTLTECALSFALARRALYSDTAR
jgi:hypothetical protein